MTNKGIDVLGDTTVDIGLNEGRYVEIVAMAAQWLSTLRSSAAAGKKRTFSSRKDERIAQQAPFPLWLSE